MTERVCYYFVRKEVTPLQRHHLSGEAEWTCNAGLIIIHPFDCVKKPPQASTACGGFLY